MALTQRELLDKSRESAQRLAAPDNERYFTAFYSAYNYLSLDQHREDNMPTDIAALWRTSRDVVLGSQFGEVESDYRIMKDRRLKAIVERLTSRSQLEAQADDGPTPMFPSVVALMSETSHGPCPRGSGVFIAKNVVLTAGHSVKEAKKVFVGGSVAVGGKRLRVEGRRAKGDLDVGLLLVEDGFDGESMQLGQNTGFDDTSIVRIVGFGEDADGYCGTRSYIDLIVASSNCAGSPYPGKGDVDHYKCKANREAVLGDPLNMADACDGDSGGPALVETSEGWRIAGVLSRSVEGDNTCGGGSIYVRTDAFRSWALEQIEEWNS